MLVNRATTVQLMQSTPLGGASSPARANSGLVGSDVMIRVSSKFESKGSSNVLSGGSQDALYFYEGNSNCGTQEPLAQFASGSSRKLDSFAERFRLELALTRKRKEVSLEDCIIPPDLARDDRLSRPLLCDVPFVIAPDAVIGLDSGGKYRPAEMDACAALVSLGGLSTGQAHSAARSVSNSRPDSFPLSASYSSERVTATRVDLLEDEQDFLVLGEDFPRKVDFSSSTSDGREL